MQDQGDDLRNDDKHIDGDDVLENRVALFDHFFIAELCGKAFDTLNDKDGYTQINNLTKRRGNACNGCVVVENTADNSHRDSRQNQVEGDLERRLVLGRLVDADQLEDKRDDCEHHRRDREHRKTAERGKRTALGIVCRRNQPYGRQCQRNRRAD